MFGSPALRRRPNHPLPELALPAGAIPSLRPSARAPESARAALAGFIPSIPSRAPRTRAVRSQRVALIPIAASARSVARGRAARVWGHGLARACSAHVALSVSLAPHASQTLLQLVLPARTPASHAPGMRR